MFKLDVSRTATQHSLNQLGFGRIGQMPLGNELESLVLVQVAFSAIRSGYWPPRRVSTVGDVEQA